MVFFKKEDRAVWIKIKQIGEIKMATITYNDSSFPQFMRFLEELKENLTREKHLTHAALEIIILYLKILYKITKIESFSRNTIKELRNMLTKYEHGCEHCAECWGKVLDAAREGRNQLIQIFETLPNNLFFKYPRKKIENVLIDWDDFIEDLTLCMDDEFKELINQLSESV